MALMVVPMIYYLYARFLTQLSYATFRVELGWLWNVLQLVWAIPFAALYHFTGRLQADAEAMDASDPEPAAG